MHRRIINTLAVAASLSAAPAGVGAQTIDPPVVRPDRERFEPSTDVIRDSGVALVQSTPQGAPPSAGSTFIDLQAVEFEGSRSEFTDDELQAFFSPLVGTRVSVGELYARAQKIEDAYRARGFATSRVIVPAQRIADGKFRLLIIEGYIDSIDASADLGPARKAVKRLGARILDDSPIRESAIEQFALLVSDLPGVSGQTVIRPSARAGAAGASDIEYVGKRRKVEAFTAIDNRGSVLTGPWAVFAGASLNSFTGFGDQLQISLYSTIEFEEQQVGQISYSRLVGGTGLRAGASASIGRTKPGGPLAGFGFDSETLAASVYTEYPVIRREALSLWAGLSAGFVNSDTDRAPLPGEGPNPVSAFSDRTRTITASARWRAVVTDDPAWGAATAGSIEIARGFGGLGATPDVAATGVFNRSRADGDAEFIRVSGEAQVSQDLPGAFQLYARIGGQWSPDPLLAIEEYQIGAQRFGRAYEPAQLTGDSAAGLSLELQADLKRIDAFDRVLGAPLSGALVYAFADVGAAWNEGFSGADTLVSSGAGVRLELFDHIAADFEAAIPVNEEVRFDPGKNVQFFVRLAAYL